MASKKSRSARHTRPLRATDGATPRSIVYPARHRTIAQKTARVLVPIVLLTMAAGGIAQLSPARAQSIRSAHSSS